MNAILTANEASQKSRAYAGLAHHYAAEQLSWLAVHAQFLADLSNAEALLLNSSLPVEQFAQDVVANVAPLNMAHAEPYQAAIEARHAVRAALPENLQDSWEANLGGLSYLEERPYLPKSVPTEMAEAWLAGEDPLQFVEMCRAEQSDFRSKASAARIGMQAWEEIEATYGADMAAFRGWLVLRSIRFGDISLTSCDITWMLASRLLEAITEFPEDPQEAANAVRSRLAWAVNPIERASLAHAITHGLAL